MPGIFHRSLFLAGPAGSLEASLWTSPNPKPPLTAVVCHPHPLFAGTMHNKVVFQAARTLHRLGLPVLRFNFRGAGLSEGTHDKGRGEQDDVRAALDYLGAEFPARPVVVAGFSFGAWVGLRVGCEDARVSDVIGLGLPVNDSVFAYLGTCAKPRLFVQGERDQFGDPARLVALVVGMPEAIRTQTTITIIPAVDHFFTGKLEEAGAALTKWLRFRHPELLG
jgi:alpha/beta superfamily hydrolase